MKIFDHQDSQIGFNSLQSLFLELETEWEWVKNIEDAKIIPILWVESLEKIKDKITDDHVVMWFDVFNSFPGVHTDHYFDHMSGPLKNFTEKYFFVHTNMAYTNPRHIYFDHIFNRQKLYFTDYREEYNLNNRVYTYGCYKEIYNLPEIIKLENCKKFLSPTRTYDYENKVGEPDKYLRRFMLRDLLYKHDADGYISHPTIGQTLFPNRTEDEAKVMNIFNKIPNVGGLWYPIGDTYYQTSFVSIYVETITMNIELGDSTIVTEKTFDPLIKGHFILPFGYQGIINDIKNYGFKLPDWIDYSFDTIKNDDDRFESYLNSVNKLLQYSVEELMNLFNKDIDILHHNRQVFFDRPYDKLYPKVLEYIKNNNW